MSVHPYDRHLRRAVRALAGLDDAALDRVTIDAQRSVLMRRGWKRSHNEYTAVAPRRVACEVWRRDDGLSRVSVFVLDGTPTSALRMFAESWARDIASHDRDAPAEVLAEALAWWDAP